jgi:hypothetical protein
VSLCWHVSRVPRAGREETAGCVFWVGLPVEEDCHGVGAACEGRLVAGDGGDDAEEADERGCWVGGGGEGVKV